MDKVVALAGNPNVGKSTVFNALTGLNQHTGNWTGKTVEVAKGTSKHGDTTINWVDLPGSYSLLAHSEEEEVARDFICFAKPDAVVVVCDATCLERNMNLVLQVMETTKEVVLCVNLLDEARKKKINVDLKALSDKLKVKVIGTSARSGDGLNDLVESVIDIGSHDFEGENIITYPIEIEEALARLHGPVSKMVGERAIPRWVSIRLLEGDESFLLSMKENWGYTLDSQNEVSNTLNEVLGDLRKNGYNKDKIADTIAETFVRESEEVCKDIIVFENLQYDKIDRKLDWLFTSKKTGFPIMFLLLLGVFWLTISGANVPSAMLAEALFWLQDRLVELVKLANIPEYIYSPLIFGVYRVLAWVVSVMLPPMAIFFPMFTLLEDFGYLPRVAFNLDNYFKKSCACGKQALTMCMGFGCNAAGVTGCKIIDSPRERLIAIITNNFVPCNGRFPTIIAVITMFLVGTATGLYASFISAFLLCLVIVLGVYMTLFASKLLSKTMLKGIPSSFALELPPYRKPQLGKVIVRSIFDRTLLVLARAIVVAAPAGLVIWAMANITIGDMTLLAHSTAFLDPFARLMGLDGVILMAFILGMPANEIVVPVMLMAYLAKGSLLEIEDINVMKELLVNNGWTWITAVSTILFTLMHWPCGTTLLTIRKEAQSMKWMFVSFLVPTVMGIIVCISFTTVARLVSSMF